MRRRKLIRAALLCSLTLLATGTAVADWPGEPDQNVPVSTADGQQRYPLVVTDGDGGAIIAWPDARSGVSRTYAQRLSSDGQVLWTDDGVLLGSGPDAQWTPVLCADGNSGAIAAWEDRRQPDGGIHAQRIDENGNVLWTAGGVVIAAVDRDQEDPQITTDGQGGAIVTWHDERNDTYDVYAQRVDGNGTVQWTTNGVPIATGANYQFDPVIAPDGTGGAYIVWEDDRPGDLFVQRVDGTGKAVWTAGGISVVTVASTKDDAYAIPDSAGGVMIAWEDRRGADQDIYAQRLDRNGSRVWGTEGAPVSRLVDSQGGPRLGTDGSGGAIIAFSDRNAYDEQIYAQRVGANGDILWALNGVTLSTAPKSQFNPRVVTDGSGGAIVSWVDFRNGTPDIYAQRVASNGAVHWTADGVPVSNATGHQNQVEMVADGAGGAILAWEDNRDDLNDIYAQRIDPVGDLGEASGLSREYRWTRLGGPNGGLGYDVRIDPEAHAVMYVTDNPSGVNKSTDAGLNWVPKNNGITTRAGPSKDEIPIFCLTVDPGKPNIVWAGTQYDRGIFKSIDGGENWKKMVDGVTEGSELTLRNFAIHPKNSNIVFAGAEITTSVAGRVFDKAKGKIYKTTDGGKTWRSVWSVDSLVRFILFDYDEPDTLYACTGIFDREAFNTTGAGILKSVDGGEKWVAVNKGIKNLFVGYLEMHPKDPKILYAAAGNNPLALPPTSQKGEVYRTEDGGQNWETVLDGDVFTMVTVSPSHPDTVYAGSEAAIYRSENGGKTWETLKKKDGFGYGPPGIRAGIPISGVVHPRDPFTIFVNNYNGGNFKSSDGGKTWVDASQGYTGAHLHDIDAVPNRPGTLVTVGRNGPFQSTTGGASWIGLSYSPGSFPDWYAIALKPEEPQTIIASDEHQGVLVRSTDGGRKWKEVFRHPSVDASNPNNRHGFRAITFGTSNPDIAYAGMARDRLHLLPTTPGNSYGMVRSENGGKTWKAVNNGLPTLTFNVLCITVDRDDADRAYIGTWTDGVYRTTDGGKSWTAQNTGLTSLEVRAIAIDPSNPMTLYAGLGEGEGVVKSLDGGDSWAVSSKGMTLVCPPSLSRVGKVGDGIDLSQPKGLTGSYASVPWTSVWAIVVDPANPDTVYAADQLSGVYVSEDAGKHWHLINDGLTIRTVNAMAISEDGTVVYAATKGAGVFRLGILTPVVLHGTIGSELTLSGADFGTKAGKILIGGKKAKVISWSPSSVRVLVKKKMPPGKYAIVFQPKGKGAEPVSLGSLQIHGPELTPFPTATVSPGDSITIHGGYFGTKRGKVFLVDAAGKQVKCKVGKTDWQANQIRFVVSNKAGGRVALVVTNKVGSAWLSDAFDVQ